MLRAIALFLGCCLSSIVQAADAHKIYLKPKQSEFELRLAENPTTGFVWQVKDIDKEALKLLKKDYKAESPKRIGSGGEAIFSFKVLNGFSKKASFSMTLKRPWEEGNGKVNQYLVLREKGGR